VFFSFAPALHGADCFKQSAGRASHQTNLPRADLIAGNARGILPNRNESLAFHFARGLFAPPETISRAKQTSRTTDRAPAEPLFAERPRFARANCRADRRLLAPQNVSCVATRSSRTPQATRRTESCGPAFSIGADAFRQRLMGRRAARAARFGPASPPHATADAAPYASLDANVATVRVAQCAQFSQGLRECQQGSACRFGTCLREMAVGRASKRPAKDFKL
jgi:hypothetical protein